MHNCDYSFGAILLHRVLTKLDLSLGQRQIAIHHLFRVLHSVLSLGTLSLQGLFSVQINENEIEEYEAIQTSSVIQGCGEMKQSNVRIGIEAFVTHMGPDPFVALARDSLTKRFQLPKDTSWVFQGVKSFNGIW